MIRAGLVSITFRQLCPREVVAVATTAGLSGIEWGGDVHVPPGDLWTARDTANLTRDAGLTVAAYGSYYHAGTGHASVEFASVLDTAVELGAAGVRVWAGRAGSADSDQATRQAVVDDLRTIAAAAAEVNVGIICEYHANTLTDTGQSARALLQAVNHPNVGTYWQPPREMASADCLATINSVAPWLGGLHVFQWDRTSGQRLPLADGHDCWPQYLARAAKTVDDAWALLEFVRNDDPEALNEDAHTLLQWLDAVNAQA